jgi:signal transduction histidine kinase
MDSSYVTDLLRTVVPENETTDFITNLMEAIPVSIGLLNEDRRLIYANKAMTEKLEINKLADVLDLRPGDLLQCVNANITEAGCGTAPGCEFCGAMQSMKKSRTEMRSVSSEYRVMSSSNGQNKAYNFRFTSTPLENKGSFYYLISLQDISNEVRKDELEQIFMHDLLNYIGGLHGVIELMKEREDTEPVYLSILESSYNALYDSINEQRQYMQAESGKLTVKQESIDSHDLLIESILPFGEDSRYRADLRIADNTENITFTSDPALLSRVLTNMVKNALEASDTGDTVTVGAYRKDNSIRFQVHNPAVIPAELQHQIFERSFSTKGKGRGVGTFSMKLLGESYLNGSVNFSSDRNSGTTFYIDLPLSAE